MSDEHGSDEHEDKQPIGPVLDALNVPIYLDPHDRVVEVLVIAKVIDMETGVVGLNISSNDLDWIAQGGLVKAYESVVSSQNDFEQGD